MSKRAGIGIKRLVISGDQRGKYGIIVQFENGIQKHFPGKNNLREAAKFADRYETKILVISNPDTIYRDMQGTRRSIIEIARRVNDTMFLPELRMLAMIGRKDLFNGRL